VHASIQIMEGNPTASLNAKTAGLAHVEDQPQSNASLDLVSTGLTNLNSEISGVSA
jgi:hypothetical protein